MLDISWNNIVHSNTINFIILYGILGYIAFPKIKAAILKTKENTTKDINESINLKEKSIEDLEFAKQDYEKTPQITEEISKIAKDTIDSLKQKYDDDTLLAKQLIEKNANKSFENELEKINTKLSKEMAEKSIHFAKLKVEEKLNQDINLHNKLIEQAIDELEKI